MFMFPLKNLARKGLMNDESKFQAPWWVDMTSENARMLCYGFGDFIGELLLTNFKIPLETRHRSYLKHVV